MTKSATGKVVTAAVVVAALGYFVDIFDLLLFAVVRVPSLADLGYSKQQQTDLGVALLNFQMGGMLLGGLLWGVWGDKRGRIAVLFGSIITYSIANIANGFVANYEQYAALRFIAGIGLAGELGAGITLVAETISQEKRGYSTTLVASIGVLGAVAAALIAQHVPWRTAYFIGGGMGLTLLLLRIGVFESGMFQRALDAPTQRGSIKMLFNNGQRLKRFLSCIACGVPIWFIVGIFITLAKEFGEAFGISPIPSNGTAVLYCYVGLSVGDLTSGVMSQLAKSRRRAIGLYIIACFIMSAVYLSLHGASLGTFYAVCFGLGVSAGYWAVFVTTAAEQFGTNLRATVATSVPNFVRGSVVPITLSFTALKGSMGVVNAAWVLAIVTTLLGVGATFLLEESFHTDLDFLES
jgi:predicted MFS family arabinose efflux permease